MNPDFWLRMTLAGLVIIGIWNAMGEGDILSFVGDWLEKHAPHWGKPIGLCPPCMSSVWGSAVWFLTGGEWTGVFIFVLALSGLMKIVMQTLLKDG